MVVRVVFCSVASIIVVGSRVDLQDNVQDSVHDLYRRVDRQPVPAVKGKYYNCTQKNQPMRRIGEDGAVQK